MAGGADVGMGLGDMGMGLGDIAGGGGGGDPTGGGVSNEFSGDPTLTGGNDMSSLMSGAGLGGGSMSTGSSASAVADPGIGAEQSQAPQPGTSPTSFGGQQSAPQTNEQIQQLIKQLSGVHNQASPLEAAAAQGQGYGGGQAGTSTGLRGTAESSYPESTFAQQPGQVGPRDGFGGGSPTQQQDPYTTASNSSQPAPASTSNAPRGNVPIGATAQPIPPMDSTTPTPPSSTSPGQPTPDEAAQIPKLGQTDTTPPKPTTAPKTALPRDPNVPKPEAPTTGDGTGTPPAAPAAPAGPGGGQPGAGQQGAGSRAPGQQQMNPMKLFGDLIQAMFGNPAPLLHDLAAGQGAFQGPPGAGQPGGIAGNEGNDLPRRNAGGEQPPQQEQQQPQQSTPEQIAGMPANTRPGAPDARPDTPDDGLKKQREEWYKDHDRTDPFPEPQGPVNPKTGIGPGGNKVATAGENFELNPRGLAATADRAGHVNPDELYKTLYNNVPKSLIGFVPKDGARFGIHTGSREEWAKLQFKLATQESSRSLHAWETWHGRRQDAGLFQFAPSDLARRGLGTNVGDPMAQIKAMNMEFEKIRKAGVIGGQSAWPGRGVGAGEYFGPLRDSGINRGVIAKHAREADAVAARNRSPNQQAPTGTARQPRIRGIDLLRDNRASLDDLQGVA